MSTTSRAVIPAQIASLLHTEKSLLTRPKAEISAVYRRECLGRVSLAPDCLSKAQMAWDIATARHGRRVARAALEV